MSILEIKPDYYDDFHCVGGQCSFTCCQEWKIAVDKDTKKRWRSITAPKGLKDAGRLPEGLSEHSCLNQFIVKKDESDVIGLLPNMKCPFLDEDHLCRLVIDHGEQVLSETCHTFPRDTHTYTDRIERTLVSCCPEIVDRWNERDKLDFIGLNYTSKEALRGTKDKLKLVRDLMMYHLSHIESDNRTNLLKGFFIILDIYGKDNKHIIDGELHINNTSGKSKKVHQKYTDDENTATNGVAENEISFNIEDYIDDQVICKLESTIDSLDRDAEASLTERNELFLDMTENYAAEGRYNSYINPLRNAAERLDTSKYKDFIKAMKPYETLFRNYLVAETFTSLLIPGMDIRDMVMQYEWMMMEYAVMMDALYIKWQNSTENISYETVREIIVLISRLTGYDADDIEDYLCDCFESPVWDFSYADFLLG